MSVYVCERVCECERERGLHLHLPDVVLRLEQLFKPRVDLVREHLEPIPHQYRECRMSTVRGVSTAVRKRPILTLSESEYGAFAQVWGLGFGVEGDLDGGVLLGVDRGVRFDERKVRLGRHVHVAPAVKDKVEDKATVEDEIKDTLKFKVKDKRGYG